MVVAALRPEIFAGVVDQNLAVKMTRLLEKFVTKFVMQFVMKSVYDEWTECLTVDQNSVVEMVHLREFHCCSHREVIRLVNIIMKFLTSFEDQKCLLKEGL